MIQGDHWYALQVRPRAERAVARQLEDKGYTCFLPLCRSRRRWSDRVKVLELPLFPGYVLCQVTGSGVGRIVTTPGVIRFIGAGKVPIPIDEREVEAIQRAVASGIGLAPAPFQVGQQVEITAGALRGVHGTVARLGSSRRLFLSISLLRRSVMVELGDSDVLPDEEAPAVVLAPGTVSGAPSRARGSDTDVRREDGLRATS